MYSEEIRFIEVDMDTHSGRMGLMFQIRTNPWLEAMEIQGGGTREYQVEHGDQGREHICI